jgi:hypothetical protein
MVDVPDALWEILKTTGLAGFALIAWWLERRERIDQQKAFQLRTDALVDDLKNVTSEANAAIQRIYDLLSIAKK